jgi:hypothetical protein
MLADPFRHNTIDNMFTSVSLATASAQTQKESDLSLSPSFIPGATNGSLLNHFRYFKLFPYLNDDIKFTILSFVADAPFERLPENYPVSTLTHNLPLVCRKFRDIAEHDVHWKNAILRSCKREPELWKAALDRLCVEAKKARRRRNKKTARKITSRGWVDERDEDETNGSDTMVSSERSDDGDDPYLVVEKSLTNGEETIPELLERTLKMLRYPRLKDLYENVVNTQLRFSGSILEKEGHVIIGEPYALQLCEPRYCIMINEIMKHHTVSARREGAHVTKDAFFIHANRLPLQKSQTAVLVQVTRCEALNNGTFEIQVVPFQHVWIERAWEVPNTFGLVNGQVLKMGKKTSNLMNHLIRQETMVQVMDNMTRAMAEGSSHQESNEAIPVATFPENLNESDDNSYLSNQYNDVTDDEVQGDSDSSLDDTDDSFYTSDDDSVYDDEGIENPDPF